jgi:hypothetical protein
MRCKHPRSCNDDFERERRRASSSRPPSSKPSFLRWFFGMVGERLERKAQLVSDPAHLPPSPFHPPRCAAAASAHPVPRCSAPLFGGVWQQTRWRPSPRPDSQRAPPPSLPFTATFQGLPPRPRGERQTPRAANDAFQLAFCVPRGREHPVRCSGLPLPFVPASCSIRATEGTGPLGSTFSLFYCL